MKIERNKNPAGRVSNIGFGVVAIIDGIVRVLSLGFLHTDLMLSYARRQARAGIERMKNNA